MSELAPSVFCIGMAGTGKTRLVQRLNSHLLSKEKNPYIVNLDPAVLEVPYQANIDIRDSLSYKTVMEEYGLGPNGAIITSLNLFSTKFDQILKVLEQRVREVDMVILDTPGQIEVFTWSASGTIILESIATISPSILLYIVDTPRCLENVSAFMANMLYSCSILFKSQLPLIVVFNKIDQSSSDEPISWLRDYFSMQAALHKAEERSPDSSYLLSLIQSMGLVLEEFYNALEVVSVSAESGEGMEELLKAIDKATVEFYKDNPSRITKTDPESSNPSDEKRKRDDIDRILRDLSLDKNDKEKNPNKDEP
jgi:GPN-loop GTPase